MSWSPVTRPVRWLVLALIAASPAWAKPTELLPLPEPTLEGVEDAVRTQLVERRRTAAEWIAAGELTDSEVADAYGGLGQLYFAYDIMDAAEPCLLNARNLDPGGFRWRYLLGALFTRSGDIDRALEELLAASGLRQEDVPTHVRLGRLYLDLARLEEAERHFRKALENDDRIAAGHHGLGLIALERGEWGASVGHLNRALALQPRATSIHYLLGIAHRELGELDEARRHLALNRHDPVLFSDTEIDRLDALIEGGRYYVQLGELALGRGNYAEAMRAFREAVSRGPGDALAHYNLGLTLIKTGSATEGLDHLQEAVRLDPEYRDAHFNLGGLLADAGRMAEAESHFASALAIDPADDEARLAWTRSLIRLDRASQARTELEAMLERDSADPELVLALAEALEALGRSDEARRRLQELVADSGEATVSARAHAQLARLAQAAGDRVAAIEHLREAVGADPRLEGAYEWMGALLGQEGEFAQAAIAYRRAVEFESRSLTARFGLAMALLLSGESRQAWASLEEGVERVDDRLPLRHLLARLLATAPEAGVRDGTRSLEIAREVYRTRETSEHAETVAMALAEGGDFGQAIAWQERALALASATPGRDLTSLRRRLELYRAGQPCRSPWLGQ